MRVHCKSEKKGWRAHWVEVAKHVLATCLQYPSLSVKEGGMNILSPYSFGLPSGFWSRISSSLAKYRLCVWAINFIFRLTKRPKTAQINSYRMVINWWMKWSCGCKIRGISTFRMSVVQPCNFSDCITPQPPDPVQKINGSTSWS
jgi:hypothetical protein